jgi:hypothetical protein
MIWQMVSELIKSMMQQSQVLKHKVLNVIF